MSKAISRTHDWYYLRDNQPFDHDVLGCRRCGKKVHERGVLGVKISCYQEPPDLDLTRPYDIDSREENLSSMVQRMTAIAPGFDAVVMGRIKPDRSHQTWQEVAAIYHESWVDAEEELAQKRTEVERLLTDNAELASERDRWQREAERAWRRLDTSRQDEGE